MSGEEGFLARWSRRKREEARPAPVVPEPVPSPEEVPGEEPAFDLASLPAIEDLNAGSDIAVFMQKGVPEALRNAALRKFWALDPDIAAIKGPVDYAWDFNDPNAMLGFGPMEAGYDPSAMLRQVMGIVEPKPDDVAPGVPDMVAERGAELAEMADHSPLDAVEPPSPETPLPERISFDAPAEKISENQIAAPRKRHGGALPEI